MISGDLSSPETVQVQALNFATVVGLSICTWVQVLNHFRFQLLPLIRGQSVWVYTLSLSIFDELVVHHILGHLNAGN